MRCLGLTKDGKRCKRYSKTTSEHYGLPLNTCCHHSKVNIIYDWSINKENLGDMPKEIRKYIKMYESVINHFVNIDPWLAICAVTDLYNVDESFSGPTILRKFFFRNLEIQKIGECPICISDKNKLFVKTKCGHTFCRECIVKWSMKKFSCPICRRFISSQIINEIQ